jgi:hypothetical protein
VTVAARARAALHDRFVSLFPIPLNRQGYASCPQDNLLPGISLADVESDLCRGDGHELDGKFCAAHSSAALAVNCFGPFKTRPDDLLLCGQQGAQSVEFEKQLPTSLRGTPPNMDVWIERGGEVVAVESKLLEYLTPKPASFAEAYARLAEKAEPCWRAVYEQAREGAAQYLDRAQLIKHYFGLRAYRECHPDQRLSLLYLFWEPLNWVEVAECKGHREELGSFAQSVSASCSSFRWTTYSQLWEEWSTSPALAHHARRLKARYEVRI